jgi:hypothetical protein
MSQPIKGVRKATPEDFEFAAGLLNQGEPLDGVRDKLLGRGLTQTAADGVIGQIVLQSVYGEAAELLNAGNTPDDVVRKLTERGLPPETARGVVNDLLSRGQSGGGGKVRMMVGGGVFVLGILLLLGNMTGAFVTFPFAGTITMVIGGIIMGSGGRG